MSLRTPLALGQRAGTVNGSECAFPPNQRMKRVELLWGDPVNGAGALGSKVLGKHEPSFRVATLPKDGQS